jgi:hypothetical protein
LSESSKFVRLDLPKFVVLDSGFEPIRDRARSLFRIAEFDDMPSPNSFALLDMSVIAALMILHNRLLKIQLLLYNSQQSARLVLSVKNLCLSCLTD